MTGPRGGEIPGRGTWPADLAQTNPALFHNIDPNRDAEPVAEGVLIAHLRRDIKGCSCGTWGSDHGNLGQSHAGHLLAELCRAGLTLVRAPRQDGPPMTDGLRDDLARWEFARHAPARYWGSGALDSAHAAAYEAADELLALVRAPREDGPPDDRRADRPRHR